MARKKVAWDKYYDQDKDYSIWSVKMQYPKLPSVDLKQDMEKQKRKEAAVKRSGNYK